MLSTSSFSYGVVSKGKVVATKGPVITSKIPFGAIGDICTVEVKDGELINAQVVSFSEDLLYLAPFNSTDGIYPGAVVKNTGKRLNVKVSESLLGKVIDSLGSPIDGSSINFDGDQVDVIAPPPSSLSRRPIREPLITGIRSIDACCTIGHGQRVGLFAGAGIGKSTLLGMITKNSEAEVIVVALVGERGREVREFIDEILGEEGKKRAVIVVSTSDESAIRRAMAPYTATAIAEYFRDQGKRVLLLVDSITRMARALREIGLASGELPVRQGFPPSVFSELPKLLERAGTNQKSSITGIYTVLTNSENELDVLGEEVKSILDGHIVLSSQVLREGIRPSIDLLSSVSRLYSKLRSSEIEKAKDKLCRALLRLKRDKDILLLGGRPDKELQGILDNEKEIIKFLNQDIFDVSSENETINKLFDVTSKFV